MKVLVVIGAIALLPMLALAQQSQLPQPRKPGQWCPEGWSANGELLCTGVRQGAAGYSQERLVSGRLAREWRLLHSLRVCSSGHLPPLAGSLPQQRADGARYPIGLIAEQITESLAPF